MMMTSMTKDKNNRKEIISTLLDWTSKQGRILTANGLAEHYYTAERGYPFEKEELPHFYLLSNDNETHDVFSSWCRNQNKKRPSSRSDDENQSPIQSLSQPKYPICGAWTRPLFVGGFEHSTNDHEIVFNIQTNTLFIDMRIPRLASQILHEGGHDNFSVMNEEQLRLYARRHAFAGYTVLNYEQNRPVCTRHHCIDWNFVGIGRNRPNKWFVEMHPKHSNTWKENSFAKDDFGQHYYWERWERLKDDANGDGLILALRKQSKVEDGIIVVVGNHFNYIFARKLSGKENTYDKGNLVDLVDAAIKAGDRVTAESYLSIDAGHGTISNGWMIDSALQYWKEGTSLFSNESGSFVAKGDNIDNCLLTWNKSIWDIYESSLQSMDDFNFILQYRGVKDQSEIPEKILNIIHGNTSKKRKISKDPT